MTEIVALHEQNSACLNRVDNSFTVHRRLIPYLDGDGITFDVAPVSRPYVKNHTADYSDAARYTAGGDHKGYFVFDDDEVVGQILLERSWNGLVTIEDIRVSPHFRRRGIAGGLIRQALRWTTEQRRGGLRLETQTTNVDACLFYRARGFVLRGVDFGLYSGIAGMEYETALFWYLPLDRADYVP